MARKPPRSAEPLASNDNVPAVGMPLDEEPFDPQAQEPAAESFADAPREGLPDEPRPEGDAPRPEAVAETLEEAVTVAMPEPPTGGGADLPRATPGSVAGDAAERASRGRKPKKGELTTAERAQAAVGMAEFLDSGLSMLATFMGSSLTPQKFCESRNAAGAAQAAARGLAYTPGMPLDLDPGALARGNLSGLLVCGVTLFVVEDTDPDTKLPRRRPVFMAGDVPKEALPGAVVVDRRYIPATPGMVIAYNLADVPGEFVKVALEWVKDNEATVRAIIAGLTAGSYAWAVYKDSQVQKAAAAAPQEPAAQGA